MALENLKSYLVRTFLRYWGHRNARTYDISSTIVVASSPRGGSTWLAEIVGALPGYPLLWEPLHPGIHPECREYGFGWSPENVPPGDRRSPQQQYLRQVLNGTRFDGLISHLHWRHSLKQIWCFRGFVVKFTRANMLLYWMLQQFPARALLMVRHPCAVVSSQMRHSAWDTTSQESLTLPQRLVLDYPHLADVYQTVKTREQALAFRWAIETYVPLTQPKPHPWLLTTYERLVEDGPAELERIYHFLRHPIPPQACEHLYRPSATTVGDSFVGMGRNPLEGWRDRLTGRQVETILDIVCRVGVDFYSDAMIPDYAKLSEFA